MRQLNPRFMNRFNSGVEGYPLSQGQPEQPPKKMSEEIEESNEQPLVDFELLLRRRDEVRKRLRAVEQIAPEATHSGDDVGSIMRDLAARFEYELTGNTGFRGGRIDTRTSERQSADG